jgi:hypothetical protein
MTSPIQLSLAGDGRLVLLTPQTVRPAYYQFIGANPEYPRSARYRLDVPLQGNPDRTLLDGLQSAPSVYLQPQDIQRVEREINRQIVENGLGLVADEGRLLAGSGFRQRVGQNRQRVVYTIRYGLFWILSATTVSQAIAMKNVDLVWQDRDFDLHHVRYVGLRSSLQNQRIELVFRDRLNLSKSWICSRAEFRPRQVFRVSAIYACAGFSL